MTAVAGLRGTGTSDWATDERPKNFREMILWRDPNGQTPLTALMGKMRDESVDDPEFSWYEEEQKPARIQAGAAATTGQTSLTVYTGTDADATALDLVAGDVLLVEKLEVAGATFPFELVEVSSDPSVSTTLAISRGAANTGANTATIASGTYLLKIGSAFEEGSSSPEATSRKPTKIYNYTQIFKHTYRLTNTAKETRFRTGDPTRNDKKRKMFDHAVAMELAFLFGTPYETTGSGNKPKRYTGGLYHYLATNYVATTKETIKIWTTTAVTEEDILDAVHPVFDFGYTGAGNERIALCGNGFANYLNKIVMADSATQLSYNGTITQFGMKLTTWMVPQGTIYIKTHPLMNTNSRFKNGCFIINPAAITYRPIRNRDTKFKDNVQANDDDETKGLWISECGAEFHHLRSMKYLAIQV